MLTVGLGASHTTGPLKPSLGNAGSVLRRVVQLVCCLAQPSHIRTVMAAMASLLFEYADTLGRIRWTVSRESEGAAPKDQPVRKDQGSAAEMGARLEALVQELSRTATQLEAVLEATENGIVMVGTDFTVRFFNQKMTQWLNIPAKDVVGQSLSHLATLLKARAQEPEELERHLLDGYQHPEDTNRFEVTITSPAFRVLRAYAGPVYTKEGETLGRLIIFSDVTEQQRLQALRDEFLSVAAHELKTPVTVIKGYAELLLQHPPAGLESRAQKALDAINRQTDRINRLVLDLIEISRLQMGQLDLRREHFDLAALVGDMVARVAPSAPHHQLIIHAPAPVMVDADRMRLQQVIGNLLDNAIKYSPGGGRIESTIASQDGNAVVSITDRGIGIPQARQQRVFQRFYRAHAGTPQDFGGMGVGLYISSEIIARHGGQIWFNSQETRGSTFSFSLPLASRKDRA